jgi:hypothetical protein
MDQRQPPNTTKRQARQDKSIKPAAALPPDVREVYDLPIIAWMFLGYAPSEGAQPQGHMAGTREVRDLPHLGRAKPPCNYRFVLATLASSRLRFVCWETIHVLPKLRKNKLSRTEVLPLLRIEFGENH